MAVVTTAPGIRNIMLENAQTFKQTSNKTHVNAAPRSNVDIIDIRRDRYGVQTSLKEDILSMLQPESGERQMPTLLLYNERGLQLFEDITYLPEYYLTENEIKVLKRHAVDMAQNIKPGSMVIELGSGNLRKVSVLLEAIDASGKDIEYYALDLSLKELQRTLAAVPRFKHVKCHGLHGTYDDGLSWLKSPELATRPKCVLSLGSSIGNFAREDAATFLKEFSEALEIGDTLLIGLDACDEPSKVYNAYNDAKGLTHEFILNGLLHANEVLDEDVFDISQWKVIGEYIMDHNGGRHQAFYSPLEDVNVCGIQIKKGERIQVEQSLKYSTEESERLWSAARLTNMANWETPDHAYAIHMLTKISLPFLLNSTDYAASEVPSFEDWKGLWNAWDIVTRLQIPNEELLDQPIRLRNACIFYLGHIPTFLDMKISEVTNLPLCEPSYFPSIFERGIDPDVDDPQNCHSHSAIPDEWPELKTILEHQENVRAKLRNLYQTGKFKDRNVGRSLWMGFEHEIMHLETLKYMMLQSDKTLPPPGPRPDFRKEATSAREARVANEWFEIPEKNVNIGLNDPEDDLEFKGHFGWDNEKPRRQIKVASFQAKGRPITNDEYAWYLEQTNETKIPASWAERAVHGTKPTKTKSDTKYTNNDRHSSPSVLLSKVYLDGKYVRTDYGLIPLEYALDWPVFASYDELARCASWMGGRIPTAEEVWSIYSHVDGLRSKEAEQKLGKTVPAVNGHLINDGVEESPPYISSCTNESSKELFTDLAGTNVGFQNWHPVAVTSNGNKLAGQGGMGGVWEWTSSPLTEHEGFKPMALYPEYTADFFDGKHNIVLGGSWATHPRIAGRKSFVNWYQRNYPYAWCGARLVRDL